MAEFSLHFFDDVSLEDLKQERFEELQAAVHGLEVAIAADFERIAAYYNPEPDGTIEA